MFFLLILFFFSNANKILQSHKISFDLPQRKKRYFCENFYTENNIMRCDKSPLKQFNTHNITILSLLMLLLGFLSFQPTFIFEGEQNKIREKLLL